MIKEIPLSKDVDFALAKGFLIKLAERASARAGYRIAWGDPMLHWLNKSEWYAYDKAQKMAGLRDF